MVYNMSLSIISIRKSSCGKGMFLHLSVSHSVHSHSYPKADTPPPWADTPPGRHPPWLNTHTHTHTHLADTPGQTPPAPRDGHCSRRYTSYWNAFLIFPIMVHSHLKFISLELLHKLNSPHNYENGTQPIIELFGPLKS